MLEQQEMSRLVSIVDLRACVVDVLRRFDLPDDHGAIIADLLVDGDLRGYDDHGVSMLGWFLPRIQSGSWNPRPTIRVVSETESSLLLDGGRGFGVMPGMQAMKWCIERAKERQGIACAAVRHAGHVVASAPYVELAARSGLIGFSCVNGIPLMAAPGGLTRLFSVNPLAFAVPAGRHYPVIFDAGATVTSAQKIRIAAAEGRSVPVGLIADAQGRGTTDPGEFWPTSSPHWVGSLLPLGWPNAPHKGFGLAMLADLLAGVLSGGGFGSIADTAAADAGQFYWALDVRAFMPLEEFQARVDALVDQVKASERMEGVEEIFVPGERGQRLRETLLERGALTLSEGSWSQLAKVCAAVGATLPAILVPQSI